MIFLLGASGYFGQAFASALQARDLPFTPVSRATCDYTRFATLRELLQNGGATWVINAAGFTGRPNVDACETAREETLLGNVLLPQTVGHACRELKIPWTHLSSGCIYNGAKLREASEYRVEPDLADPETRKRLADDPDAFHGFVESDEPNFSFAQPPCSFYSGCKALAERALGDFERVYVIRPRIPFDEYDNPRNYLTKLLRYPKIYDNVNSISHRMDFANAALDLWLRKAPFGTYNVTNPGFLSTRQIVDRLRNALRLEREFVFWEDDATFYREGARAPRSNCILDSSKLLNAGVAMRPVNEALDDALANWLPASRTP